MDAIARDQIVPVTLPNSQDKEMRYADRHCAYTEETDPKLGHVYKFTGPCIVTGKTYTVTIPGPELYAYRQGQLIQTAMPSISKDDREFLITGYSPEGWKQVFSEE